MPRLWAPRRGGPRLAAPRGGGPRLAALRLDRFERLTLLAFAAFSAWVLALDLWQVAAHGRVWTGTDGVYLVDQLQYLAWVQAAAHHLLISNLFVLRPTPADYLQPAIALSGALTALGVAPWLALLAWKPVALVGCFYAARTYVRCELARPGQRRAALVLALFFGSFTVLYGSVGVIGDLMPGFLSWGYVFGLLAVALMAGALVAHGSARRGGRGGWAAAAMGALASLLHPWHGELLIAVVVGGELVLAAAGCPPGRRQLARGARTVLATAAPLAYYAALGRADPSWRLARVASKHVFPLWWVALALAPLLLAALPAYRERPRGFLAAATRAWPAAALLVYAISGSALGATPLHAFEGITIPLAVLAVQGAPRLAPRRLPHPRAWAALAVAALTLPAAAYELGYARALVAPRAGTARFITAGERRALRYLARDPRPGGVISRSYLGALVPAATGRTTYVGDCLWSQPGCDRRLVTVHELFTGRLAPAAARAFVSSSGARFLLADCRPGAELSRVLGGLVTRVLRFGCARVYVLAPAITA